MNKKSKKVYSSPKMTICEIVDFIRVSDDPFVDDGYGESSKIWWGINGKGFKK